MVQSDTPSLCHLFQAQVAKSQGRVALHFKSKGSWNTHTWEEWRRLTLQLAQGLKTLGIRKGDRIGLLSENRAEWVIADMAVLHLGAVDVPLYISSIPTQISFILNDSEATAIFVSNEEQLQKLMACAPQLSMLKWVIVFNSIQKPPPSPPATFQILNLAEVYQRGKKEWENLNDWQTIVPDDLATLIYTSGTTGDPKGVMLTHGNLVTNAISCLAVMAGEPNGVTYSFLPLSHALERMGGYYYPVLAYGLTMAFAESMDKIVEGMAETRPTRFVGVPRVFEKVHRKILDRVERGGGVKKKMFTWAFELGKKVREAERLKKSVDTLAFLQYKIADRLVFHKIRQVLGGRLVVAISGGGPLAADIVFFFYVIGIPILQGYGLTETSPVCTVNRYGAIRFDTVGPPIPGVQIRIADDGEVCVKGGNVMKGYYHHEKASREDFTPDGWLLTGDIGVIDPDGHLRITDRKKDIIVTAGGKNIAPQIIENKLKLNPYIEQVCVVGDRRKYISALIVPNFESLKRYAQEQAQPFTTPEELIGREAIKKLFQTAINEVNGELSHDETIKKFTLLPKEFSEQNGEITPTLKVKRKVVQDKYAKLIDQMY